MSFPRAGKVNAAQILAALGDVRERFQTEDQLVAEAGILAAQSEAWRELSAHMVMARRRR